VQTLRSFVYPFLKEAYQQAQDDVTDDAALIEQTGSKVKLTWGLMKILRYRTAGPGDCGAFPERICQIKTRIGIGYDVHALKEGEN